MHQARENKAGSEKLHFCGCGELNSMALKCDSEDLKVGTEYDISGADVQCNL